MGKARTAGFLGLVSGTALLFVACAPSSPASGLSTGTFATTAPAAGTARAGAAVIAAAPTASVGFSATATPEVLGPRGTPVPSTAAGTAVPSNTAELIDAMNRLTDRMTGWASGSPTSRDLLEMMDRVNMLMGDFQQLMPRMPPGDRSQALDKMGDLMGQMIAVVKRHEETGTASGSVSSPWMDPYGSMMSTPSAEPSTEGQSTPGPGGMVGMGSMTAQLDQMREQMMQMWNDQPTHSDLTGMTSQMEAVFRAAARQVASLSEQDARQLTGDLAQATQDMVRVMEAHVQSEMSSPTPASYGSP